MSEENDLLDIPRFLLRKDWTPEMTRAHNEAWGEILRHRPNPHKRWQISVKPGSQPRPSRLKVRLLLAKRKREARLRRD